MADNQTESEVVLGKAIDKTLLKRLVVYLRPYKKHVVGAISMAILAALFGALRPKLSQVAIDDYLLKRDMPGLLWIVAAIVGLLVLQSVIQYGLTYIMQYVGQQTIHAVRQQIFQHLQRLSLRFYDTNPVGRLVTRVTSDVEVLNEFFSSGLVMIVANIFFLISIVVLMFLMSVELTVITLIPLVFLLYATSIFRRKVRKTYRDIRYHLSRMNSFINENITGVLTIKLFGQERRMNKEFDSINKAYTDANVKSVLYYATFFPVVEFLSSLAIALILWYSGINIVAEQAGVPGMSLGVLFAFIQYTEMFFRPVRDLSEKYNILQNTMASSERIFDLLDTDMYAPDAPDITDEFRVQNGAIAFNNVDFSYDGEQQIIRNLSFDVKPGETVAIVGATGAGKTSIINILLRYYEYSAGEVLIDGRDIRDIKTEDLRRDIAIVMQDIFLFRGTILDNITLNNPEISDQQAINAARSVGISRYIESMPEGYNTPVQERGSTLSVGQKQLISFARALAYNPKILILDEATSNVDTETEQLIQAAIQTLLEGRTSIVIAHRLSTIQNADKILVLHHGELREAGTHDELLAQGGIYSTLYNLQYKVQEGVGVV